MDQWLVHLYSRRFVFRIFRFHNSSDHQSLKIYFICIVLQLGAGSFLLHHFSMLVNSVLLNFGLDEELHNPVSFFTCKMKDTFNLLDGVIYLSHLILDNMRTLQVSVFLLVGIILAGAGMGYWLVRKYVVSDNGSVDAGVAQFVKWAIRVVGITFIFQVLRNSFLLIRSCICCLIFCLFACQTDISIILWCLIRIVLGFYCRLMK